MRIIQEKIYHLFRLNSLKRELRFGFTFLIVLFVVLSYIPFTLYAKEFREIEAMNNIDQVINKEQMVIDNWFDERMKNIHTLSQLPIVKAVDKEKMKIALKLIDDNYSDFNGIGFINNQGMSEIDTLGQAGMDLSDQRYFLEAKKGKSYVSDVQIERHSNQPIIIFSSPVYDNDQRFQGLIFGAVRLDIINEVMKQFQFGKTGQTYLVNRNGQLLTNLRFPRQSIQKEKSKGSIEKVNTEIFQLALHGKKETKSYRDYRGVIVFGDYRWVNNDKWLIIGEIAKDDVNAPFQRMMLFFTGSLIIVLTLGLFITLSLSNRIERIIHKVLEGAQSMGKAKFDYRIEPDSYARDSSELQELCMAFNRMAEMIQSNMSSVQKSEERYRALVETSPNAIVVHQDEKIVYTNPKFVQMLKASSVEDLLGRNIIRHVHSDYQEIVRERMKQLNSNMPVGLLEEKYVLLDDSVIDVEVIATPIEYMNKPAFQVIIQDISERKQMERELHKSQEQYRAVVESVKEVIFQTDQYGQWTFLNPAWEEITGYKVEESLGNQFLAYVHPDDYEQGNAHFQTLLIGKEDYYRNEIRFLTKDGGYCWVDVFARLSIDDHGQVIGTSGTLDDITKRREAEEELRVSEERFRLLAEYSSDMITLHDEDGRYIYASPACKELLQYEVEEIIGVDAFSLVHPDDLDNVISNHPNLFESGYSVQTYRIRRKDGGYLWIESSIKVLEGSQSEPLKMIAVSRNINERKLIEQRLKEANEMLQQLSTIDGLTGVSNRRAFDARLDKEWESSRQNSTPLSLIMLDIDYFKHYNDTYGHLGGDGCLKQVAAVIQETFGQSSYLVCRYGGEEFSIILPRTDKTGVKKLGEKIRSAIEALEIPHADSEISHIVTVSVGTATIIPSQYTSPRDLILSADKAVYQAKNDGRNCVRSYA